MSKEQATEYRNQLCQAAKEGSGSAGIAAVDPSADDPSKAVAHESSSDDAKGADEAVRIAEQESAKDKAKIASKDDETGKEAKKGKADKE